jgi:hypothetical protein
MEQDLFIAGNVFKNENPDDFKFSDMKINFT